MRFSTYKIVVNLSKKRLELFLAHKKLMAADIVSGCGGTHSSPKGHYFGGPWITGKTNTKYGKKPWQENPYVNEYGPYFLPIHDTQTKRYTTFGIHGTIGPLLGGYVSPPNVLRALIEPFKKFIYCSHGCIRLSNQNITKLHQLTKSVHWKTLPIEIQINP